MTKSMQEPTFLLLTALADAPQHGYGIIGDVERISGGRVRLRAGTLYTALDRLQAEGLIETDRETVVGGRLRRYYRLTDAGANRLEVEVERMRANVTIATARLHVRHGLAGGTV
jgi:DNA-binding PadR family transcriptional regulator